MISLFKNIAFARLLPTLAVVILLPAASVTHAIAWQEIKLSGRVMLGKMKLNTSWSCVSPEQVDEGLFSLFDEALSPEGRIVRVVLETIILGNKRTNILWLDQSLGYAVLQRERLRIKARRPNYKVERYSQTQMVRMERTPATREERRQPYQEWSSETMAKFDFDAVAQNVVMTEPHALLFLLAASDIAKPGDRFVYRIYAGNRVLLMELEATEWVKAKENTELIVSASTKESGAASDVKPYKWFGMKGTIHFNFDPHSRTVLSMVGRSSLAGKIKLSLKGRTDANTEQCIKH